MIKELRERTDLEIAIDLLRKKGLSKAAKRAGNETSE